MAVDSHDPVEAARAAASRLAPLIVRTPLVRLDVDMPGTEIWLKLECLQPIRSFKLRGAANAMLTADPATLRAGVWTASAGNMAQGVAWCARLLQVPCTVVVPDGAPAAKLEAVRRLGGTIKSVPFDDWFHVFESRTCAGVEGFFVHAFADSAVQEGNATIALEILEDLPEVDAVVIPFGGGGLSCGVASLLHHAKPGIRRYAAEIDIAAPLAAAFEAGAPIPIDHQRSFVDGIGGPLLFPRMWRLASRVLDGSLLVSLDETAAAIRLLATRNSVVAEGAGAAPVAAALAGRAGAGRIVCIVSGGNIDADKLAMILAGTTP